MAWCILWLWGKCSALQEHRYRSGSRPLICHHLNGNGVWDVRKEGIQVLSPFGKLILSSSWSHMAATGRIRTELPAQVNANTGPGDHANTFRAGPAGDESERDMQTQKYTACSQRSQTVLSAFPSPCPAEAPNPASDPQGQKGQTQAILSQRGSLKDTTGNKWPSPCYIFCKINNPFAVSLLLLNDPSSSAIK